MKEIVRVHSRGVIYMAINWTALYHLIAFSIVGEKWSERIF